MGEGDSPRGLKRSLTMIIERRFRAELREDRAKIDEGCLTTGSQGHGALLGEELSPTGLRVLGTFPRVSLRPTY